MFFSSDLYANVSQCFSLCCVHNNSDGSRGGARGARAPTTLFFRPKGRKKFFRDRPAPHPPIPPFPLSQGLDPPLNNTSSQQHCWYTTFYKWSPPCKFWLQRRETWENIPSIFFCRYFRNFGCFVEGLPSPLIRISLSLLLKALQNFVIFAILVTL